MKFKERVDKTFDRYGEEFLMNSATPAKGFFLQMDGPLMPPCFDGSEEATGNYALMVMVPADTPAAVGDTVTRHGRIYAVAKTASQQVKNTVVMHILLLK